MYLFFKWLHLVAIISWMCGVLYLYRILIYHAERGANDAVHDLLSLMARRLYKYITVPAMVVGFVGGIGMLSLNPGLLDLGWVWVKIPCVLALAGATGFAGSLVKRFAAKDSGLPTSKQLRYLNEVPTVLMLIIVGMAVFRPF